MGARRRIKAWTAALGFLVGCGPTAGPSPAPELVPPPVKAAAAPVPPPHPTAATAEPIPPEPDPVRPVSTEGMVLIPGGTFNMGGDDGFEHEGPVHAVELDAFWLDRHEVTNDDFAAFVAATGYRTEAEQYGWSGVFDPESGAWKPVNGADWRHPEGPGSDLQGRGREPVVQVSWNDATRYAAWLGKRLPTEAEFEYAQRGGGEQSGRYAWGDDLTVRGRAQANLWQGEFPRVNTGSDGHRRASPVGSYPPGPFGLLDLTGNAWEWCADWYDPTYYRASPRRNPEGPAGDAPGVVAAGGNRVLRGGSFLCSENYCTGYRLSARSQCTPDSATNHMGFRCAVSAHDAPPSG